MHEALIVNNPKGKRSSQKKRVKKIIFQTKLYKTKHQRLKVYSEHF